MSQAGTSPSLRHTYPLSQPLGWLSYAHPTPMSPVIKRRSCSNCGATIHPDTTCPTCGTTHGQARRKARHKAHGYGTKTWATLRRLAIAAHPWCEVCKATEDLTGDHRNYPARSTDDVRVLCRSCNAKDARGTLR